MKYKTKTMMCVESQVDNMINEMVAAGWRIHTYTTAGNGYLGTLMVSVLFEREE